MTRSLQRWQKSTQEADTLKKKRAAQIKILDREMGRVLPWFEDVFV